MYVEVKGQSWVSVLIFHVRHGVSYSRLHMPSQVVAKLWVPPLGSHLMVGASTSGFI